VGNFLRVAAWIVFVLAAVVGFSLGGVQGALIALVAVPFAALVGLIVLAVALSVLTTACEFVALMCGVELG